MGWSPYLSMAAVLADRHAPRAADGPAHPLLRHPAVHRHAGGAVPRPRAHLPDQRRVDLDQRPDLHRAGVQHRHASATTTSAGRRSSRWSTVAVAAYVLARTRFGRTVYAIGGSESSAMLMGLRVAFTKVGVYVISGFCAVARPGCCSPSTSCPATACTRSAWSSTPSPRSSSAARCSPVVGATSSARCSACWCSASIKTLISFDGTLSSYWIRIITGVLLLAFVVVQRFATAAAAVTETAPARRRERTPVMADVARLAGVSHQTVSRVINGQTNLRPATRERVEQAIRQLGYRPNSAARALVTRRSATIGVIGSKSGYWGPSHRAPHHPGRRTRGRLLRQLGQPAEPHPRGARRRDQPPARPERRGHRADLGHRRRASRSPGPRRTSASRSSWSRATRPRPAGPSASTRSPAPSSAPGTSSTWGTPTSCTSPARRRWTEARARLLGWQQRHVRRRAAALAARRRATGPRAAATRPGRRSPRRDDVTAVFCANDQMALGLLRALCEAGRVRCPRDVSVVGFDDIPEAAYLIPPLTTVRQDFHGRRPSRDRDPPRRARPTSPPPEAADQPRARGARQQRRTRRRGSSDDVPAAGRTSSTSSASTTAPSPGAPSSSGSPTAPSSAPASTPTRTPCSSARCRRLAGSDVARAGVGAAGARGLPRGAAHRRTRGRRRRRHRPGPGHRHRHRLHGLHDGADPRRRHAALRGRRACADRPHAYVKLWKHHAAQGQADRINELAADARRGVAAALRRADLLGVGVRQGAPAVRGGPRGLRPDGALGRGRRLDRLAAVRHLRPQRLHGRLQGDPARTGAYPSPDFLEALAPGFGRFVADKLDHPIGELGDRAGAPDAPRRPAGPACRRASRWRSATSTPTSPRPPPRPSAPGQMVAIMGTSTCHVMSADVLREVPGMCGVVDGGIVVRAAGATRPGRAGSATSSAGSPSTAVPAAYAEAAAAAGESVHEHLTRLAADQEVGEHGLVALDWHSGNRSVLVDHELSGLVVGQTLATRPGGRLPRAAGGDRLRHPRDRRDLPRQRSPGRGVHRRRRAGQEPRCSCRSTPT